MQPVFQLSGTRIVVTIAAILFDIALPIILALVVRRHLGVSWRYFGYGALIFFLFQMISRVPIVQLTQTLIAPQLRASFALQAIWVIILALTAGLFEEVGRYVGYRWLMRREEKTWPKALMYGLGHGGLESMVLVGGLTLIGLINLLILPSAIGSLPPEQRAQVEQQLAAVLAQPDWLPLVNMWERLWAIVFHVAMSVVVLQVFRRGLGWLWLAIGAHALLDFLAAGLPLLLGLQGTGALLLTEAVVMVAGLIGLSAIWKLRDPPEPAAVAVQVTPAEELPLVDRAQGDPPDQQGY
jgi:uncharacterized membrane protein YhfC